MNVLSLFDGMSCGRIALERAKIKVNNYYASEIKKHAIKVTQDNYPDTIQLGDVNSIDIEKLPKKQSLDSLKVGLKRWLTKVEKHYKVKPIIYSGESYYTDFLKKEFSDYPFWIANYNFWRNQPDSHWLLWQFTEKAQVSGINGTVDINVFNGNIIYLRSTLVH